MNGMTSEVSVLPQSMAIMSRYSGISSTTNGIMIDPR